MFQKVAILGVGLIGGSFGLELKRRRLACQVVGVGRSKANLIQAKKRKLIDTIGVNLESSVRDADLVVLAGPVQAILRHLKDIAPHLKKGAIVIDVGSTKQTIVDQASKKLPKHVFFVGTHPLAGTEKSGAVAAIPDFSVPAMGWVPTKKTCL